MTQPTEQQFEVRGTVGVAEGRGVMQVDIVVPASTDAVWAALTDPAQLAAWYGRVEGDLRVGGSYHAVLFPSGWEGDGHVLACERGQRLRMESGEPGEPMTSDELTLTQETGDRTRVALRRVRPSAEMLAVYAVGTQLHLENLAAHLAGHDPVDTDAFWATLRPRYEALAAAS